MMQAGVRKDVLNRTPLRPIIAKWDRMKQKLLYSERNNQRSQEEVYRMGENFASYSSVRDLISRIIKN